MLSRGMKLHLSRVHKVTDDDAGVIDDSLDIKIDCIGVNIGNSMRVFKLGVVVAKWLFEVGGQHGTRFIKGDILPYRLWVTERIRTVNSRPHVNVREPSYLEDYIIRT